VADDKLAVFVGNDAYRLRGAPPCAQLQCALSMRLSTATRGVVSRYDYAVFDRQRCLIDDIRQLHYRRMQQHTAAPRGQAANRG